MNATSSPETPAQEDGGAALVFVCVENSCRSQMAEGFARALTGGGASVFSAGSKPSGVVNPRAIRLMAEVGVDISGHRSKPAEELESTRFSHLVTMGCGDACPRLMAEVRHDWDIDDPASLPDREFREIRDEIRRRVESLLREVPKL